MLNFVIGIQIFFLVFVRVFGLFVSTTFWGSQLLMVRLRVFAAFLSSVLMYPMVHSVYVKMFPVDWAIFWFWIINNVLIGLMFGFLISMFFSLFQIAGQFFSFQMGFSISQVLDPLSQEQIPLIGQIMALFALLVFIAINGHTQSIELLFKTFKSIPLMDFTKDLVPILGKGLNYFGFMFAAALQFALTIMGSILVATLFVGLLAKAAPQINAMLFGMPVYIGLGFLLLTFLAGNMTTYMGNYVNNFLVKVVNLFR